jgi:hypothetical protein
MSPAAWGRRSGKLACLPSKRPCGSQPTNPDQRFTAELTDPFPIVSPLHASRLFGPWRTQHRQGRFRHELERLNSRDSPSSVMTAPTRQVWSAFESS